MFICDYLFEKISQCKGERYFITKCYINYTNSYTVAAIYNKHDTFTRKEFYV